MKTIMSAILLGGCLLFVGASTAQTPEDSPTYEEIEYQAINDCHRRTALKVDRKIIKKIIATERKYNLPASLRGMLLASACSESGYNPKALGDWRTRTRRGRKVRVAKAVGLYQMWPWWETSYKVDRTTIVPATEAYMKHIVRQLKKIKCKWRTPHRRWVAAWVTAIRAPSKSGRCDQKPKHLRTLKRWHRAIRKNNSRSTCGC